MLAGYFAFKSVTTQGDSSVLNLSVAEEEAEEVAKDQTGLFTKVSSGFWVMMDMLSGRYLYHTLKGEQTTQAVKVATS
jgi:hypothetical protein